MSTNPQHTYPLGASARVRGGSIIVIHTQRCPTYRSQNEADCICKPTYRITHQIGGSDELPRSAQEERGKPGSSALSLPKSH